MRKGFHIVYEKGVSPNVVDFAKNVCARIEDVTKINHVIGVRLVNNLSKDHEEVWERGKLRILGVFGAPCKRKEGLELGLWQKGWECCIICPARIYKRGISRSCSLVEFYGTLIHEAAHYIQFRDKKKVQEKGMRKATRKLSKRFLCIS